MAVNVIRYLRELKMVPIFTAYKYPTQTVTNISLHLHKPTVSSCLSLSRFPLVFKSLRILIFL